jgi:hypothetical protein
MKSRANNSAEIFIGLHASWQQHYTDCAELERRTGAYPGRETESITINPDCFYPGLRNRGSLFWRQIWNGTII